MFPFPFSFLGSAAPPPELELIDNDFAMEFNGTDEYISAGNPTELQFTGDFSISGWFKCTGSTYKRIVSKDNGSGGSGDRCYYVQVQNTGELKAGIFSGGSNQQNASGTTVNDDNWHHFVFTFENGVGTKLYIDNGTPSTDSVVSAIDNDPADFEIGRKGNNTNLFAGDIDEIAAWNRVLSADDVQTIYNATNNNPGKCANLWSGGLGTGLVYWNRMGD